MNFKVIFSETEKKVGIVENFHDENSNESRNRTHNTRNWFNRIETKHELLNVNDSR